MKNRESTANPRPPSMLFSAKASITKKASTVDYEFIAHAIAAYHKQHPGHTIAELEQISLFDICKRMAYQTSKGGSYQFTLINEVTQDIPRGFKAVNNTLLATPIILPNVQSEAELIDFLATFNQQYFQETKSLATVLDEKIDITPYHASDNKCSLANFASFVIQNHIEHFWQVAEPDNHSDITAILYTLLKALTKQTSKQIAATQLITNDFTCTELALHAHHYFGSLVLLLVTQPLSDEELARKQILASPIGADLMEESLTWIRNLLNQYEVNITFQTEITNSIEHSQEIDSEEQFYLTLTQAFYTNVTNTWTSDQRIIWKLHDLYRHIEPFLMSLARAFKKTIDSHSQLNTTFLNFIAHYPASLPDSDAIHNFLLAGDINLEAFESVIQAHITGYAAINRIDQAQLPKIFDSIKARLTIGEIETSHIDYSTGQADDVDESFISTASETYTPNLESLITYLKNWSNKTPNINTALFILKYDLSFLPDTEMKPHRKNTYGPLFDSRGEPILFPSEEDPLTKELLVKYRLVGTLMQARLDTRSTLSIRKIGGPRQALYTALALFAKITEGNYTSIMIDVHTQLQLALAPRSKSTIFP